jgi:hypothetical protein
VIRKPFAERPKVRLDTLAGIRREMARVYRYAQRGEIGWQDATRATFILANIAKLDQGQLFEQRLAALEERLGIADKMSKARVEPRNGHDLSPSLGLPQ